ncbi:ankyrin repeat domain-containing protein [Macroventuria anomochaeta]|uniref:Ankyrin repeat domain-containing protein n=1 Tax=Macroventuria anomochaeta TaxID=301207 RepID=A0ACB6S3I0_9PLEO|nr:ankyrin repeat domain-containing protein [Macroventuria anomochaeta]KAF2628821.1 ankyrin repeat domain-containing protein [Macroventuria anomochaeta]
MDPLSVTASIIAVLQLSGKFLAYLNDVKDASKDRAQCAIEASTLYSLLVNLRCRLEEGSASQPWFTAVRALAVENGPLDQFKQALELLQAKMTDGGRLKKAGKALVWKFKKEEIASILARMERLKTLVEIAIHMDHLKLSQAIKDDTNFLRTHAPVIQSGVDTIRQDQDSARHRRLLEWISASDYPAQQSDIIRHRQEGTGQWFLDAPEVARWLNEANTILFCSGIPGAGKTMIAAIAIDHLLNTARNSSHGIVYVYCNYKAQEEQDVSSLLAAILKQLVQGRLSAMEPIERLHQKHADRGTKPSLDEIYSALRDVLTHYPLVHIVIDALDECQNATRRQLLAKLRDFQAGSDVRFMVTARYIPDIEDAFRGALRLEVQASREDVKRFVAGQIFRLPTCIQRSAALQEMVQERIVDAVDGMFILARLHIDSLLDKRTAKDVKINLSKLPKGAAALDVAYRDALERIEGQLEGDRALAKKVLSWITLAKRPLTTAEICCALAVEPDETTIDPDNVPNSEDLVSVCAGLVIVDTESAIIRLVHYTTQEYFERIGDAWMPDSQFHIASTCLTYLCFSDFQSGSCSSDKDFEARLQEHQFLDYAAKNWGVHARATEAEIADLACEFLHSGSFSCAAQILRVSRYRYEGYSRHYPTTTPLHELARLGLAGIAERILSTATEPVTQALNAEDSWNDTPLTIAARHGHCELANMLLDNGAEVSAHGGHYGNALQAASAGGHEQVFKMLLDKDADVNAQGGHYGNALQAASAGGHEQIVKTLLDKDADVNTQGGHYGNALQAASARGHEQVVKTLLDKGADVNAQGGGYGNALQAASAGCHEQPDRSVKETLRRPGLPMYIGCGVAVPKKPPGQDVRLEHTQDEALHHFHTLRRFSRHSCTCRSQTRSIPPTDPNWH